MGGEFVRVRVGCAGEEGDGEPFSADGVEGLVGEHCGVVMVSGELGLEQG